MSGDDRDRESRLQRWSRLKQTERARAREGQAPAEEAKPVAVPPGHEDAPSAPAPELPDIESLDKDSDYTVFLGDNVPDALRRLALRKLWRSDPVLANVDGLNDYDEDFTVYFKGAQEVFRTAAKAGKDLQAPDAEEEPQRVADESDSTAAQATSAPTDREPGESSGEDESGDEDEPPGSSKA